MTGVTLLDLPVHLAGALPHLDEALLRLLPDQRGRTHRHRNGDQRDQRQHRRDGEHHHQYADHRQQSRQHLAQGLLQGLGDVVDVIGHSAEQLTPRLPVEVAQRQLVDLVLDVRTQLVDGPLDHHIQQLPLQGQQQRGHDEQTDGQRQHLDQVGEVDSLPGNEVLHPGDHVGQLALSGGPELFDHLSLGGAGWELPADLAAEDAGEQDVGAPAENLRSEHVHHDAEHGQRNDEDQLDPMRCQLLQQALQRRQEVHRLLGDMAAHRAALHVLGVVGPVGSLLRRGRVGGRGFLGLDVGTRLLAHAAASSALSWDSTISA